MTDRFADGNPEQARALVQAKRLARSLEGVRAVDFGWQYSDGKCTQRPCLRFHMTRKRRSDDLSLDQLIPKEIGGIATDVIEAGYKPHAPSPFEIQAVIRPGLSIGNVERNGTGTLGAIVEDRLSGRPCILSNWHVMCAGTDAAAGDVISQPGPQHLGPNPANSVAQLTRWVPLESGYDAAIATIDADTEWNGQPLESDLAPTGIAAPEVGMKLTKTGSVSGKTHAVVDGIAGSYLIPYGGFGDQDRWMNGMRLVPDPAFGEGEISLTGDSGSVWVTQDSATAVGLHFAGEDDLGPLNEYALAHSIGSVLERLSAGILRQLCDCCLTGGIMCDTSNKNGTAPGSYTFETKSYFAKIRSGTALNADRDVFVLRLLKDPSTVDTDGQLNDAVKEFVLACHGGIHWYRMKQSSANNFRFGYAVLSIGLLALVPISVFYLTELFGATADSPKVWLAQSTAVVTGVLGVYRVINAWIQKVVAAGNFGQATSALKTLIYEFEQEWRGKLDASNIPADFQPALKEGVRAARAIIEKQRQDYFAATTPPAIDVLGTLRTAAGDAASLLNAHRSPALADAIARETQVLSLKSELSKLTAKSEALTSLISVKTVEASIEPDADRKKELESLIVSWRATRDKLESDIAHIVAVLSATK